MERERSPASLHDDGNFLVCIQQGLEKSGRKRADFTITAPVMAVMGDTDEELDAMRERVRGMIGFYGSASFYKEMFEAHDWGETFICLRNKSRNNEWDFMADEITHEMLDEFAVTGTYEEIPRLLEEKYGDMLDEVLIYFGEPEKGDPATWQRLVAAFDEGDG